MNVAVVILNWNGLSLLKQFLPSIVAYSSEANIYLADNASTDASVAFVSEAFPTVQILQNKTNGGYAKGYNDALSALSEELFILLNSDVEVTANWLVPIVSEFKNDANLVAAQPKILDYKNKACFEYAGAAGGFLDKYGYPFCRGRIFKTLEKDKGQYNDTFPIFWATGACLFVKKQAFWEAGAFDENFFAHQEEIDLCWRLKARGGTVKYVGASTIYHIGGATLSSATPQKTFYNFRNTLLTLLKNVKGNAVWGILLIRMVLDGVAACQFLISGKPRHFLAVCKAHFSFYHLFGKFLKKRKKYASDIPYYTTRSIVFQYFVRRNRYFDSLP